MLRKFVNGKYVPVDEFGEPILTPAAADAPETPIDAQNPAEAAQNMGESAQEPAALDIAAAQSTSSESSNPATTENGEVAVNTPAPAKKKKSAK